MISELFKVLETGMFTRDGGMKSPEIGYMLQLLVIQEINRINGSSSRNQEPLQALFPPSSGFPIDIPEYIR